MTSQETPNGGKHPLGALKNAPLSMLSRIFNIASSQWPRVSECWFITFFFKIGSAIGWTVMTAAFIARFGIAFLPILFVVNALFIMAGTFFFEQLIMRMKREVLMILMIFFGALCLFMASFLYDSSPFAFFSLLIIGESVFLAQFNVFIPILVGDRFTPLESQTAFPFIESGETIGGIIGGIAVGLLGATLPVAWFIYVWIILLACVVAVFVISSSLKVGLPAIALGLNGQSRGDERYEIKKVIAGVKKLPFLKSLVFAVLLQWVFMNILEFQFTKSVEQAVTHKQEETIARIDATGLHASVLFGSEQGIGELIDDSPQRVLTPIEQSQLTEKLGTLKGGFHTAALIVQALVATRVITSLGVIGSMLLHPIIMLMSLVGMFLKFGILSSSITRMNFEITNVVYKNAYFASHYALPKSIRDQAAEFLEGIVRPLGTIFGMAFIIGFQFFLSGRDLSMWIHIVMVIFMFAILITTIKLQDKYTEISKQQLFSNLPYPEKLNAIEILAQRGHKNAPSILAQKLNETIRGGDDEAAAVRMKLLSALGEFGEYSTLPDILEALSDGNPDVRLEAAHALMNFNEIGEQFYAQAFSRFRMIETLKETFRLEKSAAVRSAIIRVFSILKQPDIVAFLLDVLRIESPRTRADCIYTFGLFHDPNAAFYILPFLTDTDPMVRANALISLWQFEKYRPMLNEELNSLLASGDSPALTAGMYVLGELKSHRVNELKKYLYDSDRALSLEAAFALTKAGDQQAFLVLLDHFLNLSKEEFEHLRRFIHRLNPRARRVVQNTLVHIIGDELNRTVRSFDDVSLADMNAAQLERLRRLYILIDQHEELYAIEEALSTVAA